MAWAFLKTLHARAAVSAEEAETIVELTRDQVALEPGQDIVAQGARPTCSCLMIAGYSARYTLLSNGSRQITAIHIPGDFVDLHSLFLHPMDHGVVAISPARVARVRHASLHHVIETQPNLTRLLWTMTAIDAAIFRQWLVASGRQAADSQVARFLCEMFVRLALVDRTEGLSFELPVTQGVLGDAMGISTVQANRSVQVLRRAGLVQWKGAQVTILDWEGLATLGHFDDTYLNIRYRPKKAGS